MQLLNVITFMQNVFFTPVKLYNIFQRTSGSLTVSYGEDFPDWSFQIEVDEEEVIASIKPRLGRIGDICQRF